MSRISRRRFLEVAAGAAVVAAVPAGSGAAPRRGGVLKHIGVEPPTFDIHAPDASVPTLLMSSFVRRTLFKFVHSGVRGASGLTVTPDLARAARLSPDGRICTISLRPGVRWESRLPVYGRELVGADVKYSLDRALRRSTSGRLLGPMEGIETPDRYTVRLRLAEPFPPLLHHLAEPWAAVLPVEVEDKLGHFRGPESLIGCGPFALERFEPGIKAVFSRNPTYYQPGLPYLDKVEWIFVWDRATQLSLFRAGQIDIPSPDGRIPPSEVDALRTSRPAFPVAFWDGLAVRTLAMRTDRPPFSDHRVRRALSLAIDRTRWVARYLEGHGSEDDGAVPVAFTEWKLPRSALGAGARFLDHDPALARSLLAEAGFAHGLKVKCTYWAGAGPEYVEEIEQLACAFKEIGVDLVLVGEDFDSYVHGSALGKYDEATWGASAVFTEVDDYLYGFYRSGQRDNRSHVADARLDAMLDAQRRYTRRSARKKLIDDIQRYTAEQAFYLYTPRPPNVSSWAPWVKNYAPTNSLDRGAQLEVTWLDRS